MTLYVNLADLNRALLPHKIQIAPGSIFSAAGK